MTQRYNSLLENYLPYITNPPIAVVNNSNLDYLLKWLHMGKAYAAENDTDTDSVAAVLTTRTHRLTPVAAPATPAPLALNQSAMQWMLTNQQGISAAAQVLTAELKKRPIDVVLLTAAAWGLATAAGVDTRLQEKLHRATAVAADVEVIHAAAASKAEQQAALHHNLTEYINDYKIYTETTKKQAA